MQSGGTFRPQGGPVTQLRNLMLEEIQRRNFTESTRRAYVRIIEDFARYFNRPPDQLGPEHIREYGAHLFRDKKLSDNSVNQTVGALRLFFVKMLKRPWRVDETPYPKKRMRLPVILSRDEVASLIESAPNPFLPYHPDHPLRHRSAAGEVGTTEDHRHRF